MVEQPLPDVVRLTDPQSLRAMAHEVRQRLVAELYVGRELTATEAARQVGITPSAMSYHLRALEKWGIVERAEPRSDGRERPWRAAGKSLDIEDSAVEPTGAQHFLTGYLAELNRVFTAWRNHPQPTRLPGAIKRGVVRLTMEQHEQMLVELAAVTAKYDALSEANGLTEQAWDSFWIDIPHYDDSPSPDTEAP